MKLKVIFLLLIATFSISANANAKVKFSCNNEVDVDALYAIKSDLLKENFDLTVNVDGKQFLENNKTAVYHEFYLKCFSKQLPHLNIQSLTPDNLHRLFNLYLYVNFYSPEDELIAAMQKIITLKEAQGAYVGNFLVSLHEAYIRSRYLGKARQLTQDYSEINFSKTFSLINEVNPDRSFIELSALNETFVRKSFDFPKGGFVVILSSPICSPSNRFLDWLQLSNNKHLKSVLQNKSLFITPNGSELYIDELVKTNDMLAPLNMKYSYSRKEWPEIKLWDTPTFYFYFNGELQAQLVGWPRGGRESEFKNNLKGIELL